MATDRRLHNARILLRFDLAHVRYLLEDVV